VPYVAAELEQGIYLNVSSMELFALEGGYAGSMFNASGGAHPISTLYSTILPHLDPVVLSANVTSALPNVYALATENTTGNLSTSLLIANLNSTLSARISLTGSGFPLNSSGTVWLWNTTSSAPVSQPLGLGASSGWVMPPESIGLWVSGKSVSGLHISLKATPPTIALGDSALLNASVAIGVPPYTYAWLGLPSGCVSKNASGLKCVPAVTGTFTVSVFVNDSAGDTGSSTAVLIVDHTLSITSFTATPSTLTLGQTTSLSVSLSGGVSPYSYTFTGLPTGCASADSASMSCKPSATGNYTVRSYVNDSARNSANRTVTLAVDALCLFCGALLAITPTSDTIATGEIANFAATETCTSSCPLGMTYSWSLTNSAAGSLNSSMGSSVTFTASGAIGTVGLFVNATLDGASMESSPAIITIMALTLTSVTVSPPQSTVGLGGTQTFRAIPTCSAACPSVGIAYSWSLSSNTGNISTTTGNATTFTAGNSVGSLSLLLSATLNGASENASASITIWAPALISVAVIPNSAVVVEGATSPQFKGTPTCNATCPSGIAYSWALTNGAMGILSTTTGPSVMFAAGNTPGEVTLFVNATLNGKTVYSSAAIAVTPAHPPSSGPTPLPSGITFLIFVGVMAAVVVIAAVLVLLRRRRAQPLPSVSAHEGL